MLYTCKFFTSTPNVKSHTHTHTQLTFHLSESQEMCSKEKFLKVKKGKEDITIDVKTTTYLRLLC